MSFSPLEWQIVRFTLAVCAFSTLLILPVGLATALAAGSVSLAWETFGGDRRHFATRVTTSSDGIGAFENVWKSWPDWPFPKPAFRR